MIPYGISAPAVLDRLHRELNAIDASRIDCLAVMREANEASDDDAWDRAAQAHDDLSDERAGVHAEIRELEGIRERAERLYAPILI